MMDTEGQLQLKKATKLNTLGTAKFQQKSILYRAQNTNITKHSISVKSQQFRKDVEPVASALQKQETSFREEPNQQIWFLLDYQWSKEEGNVTSEYKKSFSYHLEKLLNLPHIGVLENRLDKWHI